MFFQTQEDRGVRGALGAPIGIETIGCLLDEAGIPRSDTRSYPVNRVVRDFSAALNLDTPENAYAALMLRVVGEKDAKQARENFLALDSVAAHGGAEQFKESDFIYNEAWAQVCRSAVLREVLIYQDRLAVVIAYLPGENVRDRFDTRTMEKIDGRWLNLGNDRHKSLEEARAQFIKNGILDNR